MAVVGAFARIDRSDPKATCDRLSAVAGVTLFDLGEPGKIGLVLEAESLDGAHEVLCGEIEKIEGVLGVWPVYAHLEPEVSDAECPVPGQSDTAAQRS